MNVVISSQNPVTYIMLVINGMRFWNTLKADEYQCNAEDLQGQ
jgi:hypothetical protein